MAGNTSDQERIFISAISSAIRTNRGNPISVVFKSERISSVSNARKYTARSSFGNEAYTDIVISPKNRKEIKLSLKDVRSPSLAGGGERGIESVSPGFISKFMRKALKTLLDQNYEEGDKVPSIFCELDPYLKKKFITGSPAIGGPIDYIYQGPSRISYEYNPNRNVLFMEGDLITPERYAKNSSLYVKLRSRRADQFFDPNALKNGIPRIFSKSEIGDTSGRFVITNELSEDGIFIRI